MPLPGLPRRNIKMFEDKSDPVYTLVERAYVRLQAGDILVMCMEQGDPAPIQHMVERLIVAGPQNLVALREIIAELNTRKSQLHNDFHEILDDLDDSLIKMGVPKPTVQQINPLEIEHEGFMLLLFEEGVEHELERLECLRFLENSREMIESVLENISLLEDLEIYLNDWLWGLIYQTTRNELSEALLNTPKSRYRH